ncbi:MAG: hypothetical protein R3D29_10975 [Nitratireductor sp.]
MTRIPPAALDRALFHRTLFHCRHTGTADCAIRHGGNRRSGFEPPSSQYWLGNRHRPGFQPRMIYGGRTTIMIATAATILSFTTGTVLGFCRRCTWRLPTNCCRGLSIW